MFAQSNRIASRFFAAIALLTYTNVLLVSPVLASTVTWSSKATNSATAPLAADASQAGGTSVSVPVGTIVDLVFDQTLSANSASLGQSVMLRVSSPVVVNGKTVIAAGTMATGEVVNSSKAGAVGKEGQLGVSIKSVTGVDGTLIPLNGTKTVVGENHTTSSVVITLLCCILGLLQQGGKAEIPAGASVRASVAAPTNVTVQ